jgi:hypothetical protein
MEELLLSAIELHDVNDVGQREMQTAEPFIPEPISSEVEIAIKAENI